jgi:hypothetical protein
VKFLRKSSVVTVIILGAWLWTTCAYSIQVQCNCCSHKEHKCCCNEKVNAGCLSRGSKIISEERHCQCIVSENINPKAILPKEGSLSRLGKVQVLTFEHHISEAKILLAQENIVAHLNNNFTSENIPLFLRNSSYLL